VVNDFAVKYMNQEDADHLINAIRKYYPLTVDKEATKYIGLTIEWDYKNRKAHIHMPDYLQKAFTRFKHEALAKIQNSPHPVIGHGISGKHIPIKCHVLLRPDAGVSNDGLVCHHPTSLPHNA
jgi:hypothetical protein